MATQRQKKPAGTKTAKSGLKPSAARTTGARKPAAKSASAKSGATKSSSAKSSARRQSTKAAPKQQARKRSSSPPADKSAEKQALRTKMEERIKGGTKGAAEHQNIRLPGPGEIFGQAAWLMMMSQTHKHLFLSDLEWLVTPPVMLKQFRIWRNNNIPFAYASWAYLNEDGEKRLLAGNRRLSPADWNNGGKAWLIDLVCPHGDPEPVLRDLKETVFADETLMTVRSAPDGQGVQAVEVVIDDLSNSQDRTNVNHTGSSA